ncbi:hypothetical protein H0H81_004937 [Sphagnurus paluster]|uniref:C2H2-type domain-containing protein n=1 Tax=Sphagnurus paluster TaxID=117069 RepID=A0A9P7FXX2_9AGAR|nr:hypothetical protein H0H81_004937 [Sphagnurus paluster]
MHNILPIGSEYWSDTLFPSYTSSSTPSTDALDLSHHELLKEATAKLSPLPCSPVLLPEEPTIIGREDGEASMLTHNIDLDAESRSLSFPKESGCASLKAGPYSESPSNSEPIDDFRSSTSAKKIKRCVETTFGVANFKENASSFKEPSTKSDHPSNSPVSIANKTSPVSRLLNSATTLARLKNTPTATAIASATNSLAIKSLDTHTPELGCVSETDPAFMQNYQKREPASVRKTNALSKSRKNLTPTPDAPLSPSGSPHVHARHSLSNSTNEIISKIATVHSAVVSFSSDVAQGGEGGSMTELDQKSHFSQRSCRSKRISYRDADDDTPASKRSKLGTTYQGKRSTSVEEGGPFPCPLAELHDCRQTFSRRNDIARHIETTSRHNLENTAANADVACRMCGKVLSRPDSRARHEAKNSCGKRSSNRRPPHPSVLAAAQLSKVFGVDARPL